MKETKYKDYYATEDGKIWSEKSHKFLSQSMRGEYLKVSLFVNKEKITVSVHRLIAETYIPNPNNFPIIHHKDENKLNNNINNLEWTTEQQNCNEGTRNQRISKTNKLIFANTEIKRGQHPSATSVIMCDPLTHEEIQIFDSIASACIYLNKYPTGQANISAVLNGRRKTAYNFFWKKFEKPLDK